MSIAIELTKMLMEQGMVFIERAIARELFARMESSRTIGIMNLDVPGFAADWQVEEHLIWSVIHRIETLGFWAISSGHDGERLASQALTDSSKAISKARKHSAMRSMKTSASKERASNLTLADANIANRSLFAEVAEIIPLKSRFEILREPYAGWLPSAAYAATGIVFKPDQALADKVRGEYPGVDVDLAFALMYEDLRECPKERPSMETFTYWIRNWIRKNADRLAPPDASETTDTQIDDLLDDYLS